MTLNDLIMKGQITKKEQWQVKSSGLLHPALMDAKNKPDISLHAIVLLSGTPRYNINKELTKKLAHLTEGSEYSINSPQLCQQIIKDLIIEEEREEIMVLFNVRALVTSINLEPVKKSWQQHYTHIHTQPNQIH